MSRINIPNDIMQAPVGSQLLLSSIKQQLGSVSNQFRIFGNNACVLEGYLSLANALSKGSLSLATRERISLAVAELNDCHYCLAAHTYTGKTQANLSDEEMVVNRRGTSLDSKAAAAVEFAATVTKRRGKTSKADFDAVRAAGYSDAEIMEIVALVVMNILTNYLNETLETTIDFPKANIVVAA